MTRSCIPRRVESANQITHIDADSRSEYARDLNFLCELKISVSRISLHALVECKCVDVYVDENDSLEGDSL